jgi:hypothetical protein
MTVFCANDSNGTTAIAAANNIRSVQMLPICPRRVRLNRIAALFVEGQVRMADYSVNSELRNGDLRANP